MENAQKKVGIRDIPIDQNDEDEKGLKINDYALALSEFIKRTETPMTIGIQGDWGSGKTSLMNLIQGDLGTKYLCIKINTWKYSQTGPGQSLAIAILLAIIHQLTKQTGVDKVKNYAQILGKTLLSLGNKVVESQVGVNIADALSKGELQKIFDQFESLEKLKEELTGLIRTVIESKSNDSDRVVVFVDDLDRVYPERAVEILEILKVFLDIDGLVFVLACDYEVILKGLRAKNSFGGEEVSGRSFFDKIIQVPFQMPTPSQEKMKTYLRGLFDRVGAGISDEDLERIIVVLGLTTGKNPRTIKRLINILNLLLLILDSEKHIWDDEVPNKAAIIFSLVALQNAFPEIYAYLSGQDANEIFYHFSKDNIEGDPGLKKSASKLDENNLNQLLEILKELVKNKGGLLLKFIGISDISAVNSKEDNSNPKNRSKQADNYIDDDPKELGILIREILKGLPDVTSYAFRRSMQFVRVINNEKPDFYIDIKKLKKKIELVFSADPKEKLNEGGTYFEKMKEFGCPDPQCKSPNWIEFSGINCSLTQESSQEQIDAVRKYVYWFLVEAPKTNC